MTGWTSSFICSSFTKDFPHNACGLKVMRNLPNFDERDFKKQIHELEIHGQEDDVAKLIALFPSRRGQLTELMFFKSQMTAPAII